MAKIQLSSKWLRHLLYVFFLLLGLFSFYIALKNYPPQQVLAEISKVNLLWLVPVYAAGFIGSACRAARWNLVLNVPGRQITKYWDAFHSLMFGYFVNLGTPRLGEVSRCLYLSRKNGTDTVFSIATVAIERVVDVLTLFLCIFLALVLQWDVLYGFYDQYIFSFIRTKVTLLEPWKLMVVAIIAFGLVATGFFLIRRFFSKFLKSLLDGLLALLRTEHKFKYILYTVLIWFSYFLTSYFWLLAFGYGGWNAVYAGFTIMGVGAIARSLPIQAGGAGPYHWLVSNVLALFMFHGVDAIAYAIINHGSMIIYNLGFGLLSIWSIRRKIS